MTLQEILALIAQDSDFADQPTRRIFDAMVDELAGAALTAQELRDKIGAHLSGAAVDPILTAVLSEFRPEAEGPTAAEERGARRFEQFINFIQAMFETGILRPEDNVDDALQENFIEAFNDALRDGVHLDPVTKLPLEGRVLRDAFQRDLALRLEVALTSIEPDERLRLELRRRLQLISTQERDDFRLERQARIQELAQQSGIFEGADAARILDINEFLAEALTDIEIREAAGQRVDFEAEITAKIVAGPLGPPLAGEADLIRLEAERETRAAALGLPDAVAPDEAAIAAEVSAAGQRQLEQFGTQQQAAREKEERAAVTAGQRRSQLRAIAAGKIAPPGPTTAIAPPPEPVSVAFANFLRESEVGQQLTPEQLQSLAANESRLLSEFATAQEGRLQERRERRGSLREFAARSPETQAQQSEAFRAQLAAGIPSGAGGILPPKLTFGSFLMTETAGFLERVEIEQAEQRTQAEQTAAETTVRREQLLRETRRRARPPRTPSVVRV